MEKIKQNRDRVKKAGGRISVIDDATMVLLYLSVNMQITRVAIKKYLGY